MPRCRSSLVLIDQEGFSRSAAKKLFGNRKAPSHQLAFTRQDVITYRHQQAERFSISGVQDKVSLRLYRGKLEPVTEHGEYILKPVPSGDHILCPGAAPANEHLTLLLAGKLFNIATPPCALMEMNDGEPAYLVQRFDRLPPGKKIPQEDFCQLSNRSEDTGGRNYKYDSTQEETGQIIKKFCPAYRVEIEKLYLRHVFNYVFSNGDAHLKNFSLQRTRFGDHVLTPAYDLLCTSLHIPSEPRCALDLLDEDETEFFKKNGYYGREDFLILAEKFGMKEHYADELITRFSKEANLVLKLIDQSFLPPEGKVDFCNHFNDRLKALK